MTKKDKVLIVVGLFVTLGIFYALFWLIDFEDLYQKITPAMVVPVLVAVLLYGFTLFLRSLRFTILFSHLAEKKLSILRLFDLVAINNIANHLLPMRLGEVIFLGLLKSREEIPLERSATGLFLTRVADLGLLLVGLSIAFFVLELSMPVASFFLGAGLFGIFCVVRVDLALILFEKSFSLILKAFKNEGIRKKGQGLLEKMRALNDLVKSPYLIFINLGFGVLVWTLNTLSFWCVVEAMNIHLNFLQIFTGSAGAAILPSLPINALGTLGPLEAGWTAGFVLVGVEAKDAASSGLLVHAMILLASSIAAFFGIARVGTSAIKMALKREMRST